MTWQIGMLQHANDVGGDGAGREARHAKDGARTICSLSAVTQAYDTDWLHHHAPRYDPRALALGRPTRQSRSQMPRAVVDAWRRGPQIAQA